MRFAGAIATALAFVLAIDAVALWPSSSPLAQSSAGGGSSGGGGGGSTTITGNLPAFAQTPTFNVGTIAGIATDASVQQVKTTLGSPFQAGGAIGNTAFGISGTLPAFASTPTFNLGTLNGAATSANQASEIAALTTANQRSSFNQDFASFGVAASTTAVGATKSLGTSPSQWAWISFNGSATVTGGTFYLQCSNDSAFATSAATVASVTVATASATPGSGTTVPVSIADRVRYPFCRVVYANGPNAGAITGSTALTTN